MWSGGVLGLLTLKQSVSLSNKYQSTEKVTKDNECVFRSKSMSQGYNANVVLMALLVDRERCFTTRMPTQSGGALVVLTTTQSI